MNRSSSSHWKRVGDAVHLANLANAVFFAYSVVQEHSWFDAVWKKDGFCVANQETPFWTSHDLCLYADVILAAVVGLLYLALRKQPGMGIASELVKVNIGGIIGHGVGHAGIAKGMRDGVAASAGTGWESMQGLSMTEILMQSVPFLIFWVFLLKAAMPKTSYSVVGVWSALSAGFGLLVPNKFGFTYVQTVLFAAFDINELLKPREDKGFEYAVYPMFVGLPLAAIAWVESTQCSRGLMDLGGHVVYDAYIPISIIAFYMTCWIRSNTRIRRSKKMA